MEGLEGEMPGDAAAGLERVGATGAGAPGASAAGRHCAEVPAPADAGAGAVTAGCQRRTVRGFPAGSGAPRPLSCKAFPPLPGPS